ncbi:MAG: sigma-54-dependent Fis family transcriptional regulator [Myxococcales bacterium]|jgi:DNA-binding NtrC family response regulator|nr:sigma-54-dependent Fis family transcriptional regulator [Myxococcales bacterium]
MTKGRILVVDDEASARNALAEILSDEGYSVLAAPDGFKALALAGEHAPEIVLTDVKMPGMDGLRLLEELRERFPETAVVLMTAFGAVETAVRAMRQGASDYLVKPLNSDELLVVIERSLEQVRLRQEAARLRQQVSERYRFENIVGSSPGMQQLFKSVAQIAPSKATVLITGESGTGKELIAAAIHQRSGRADKPFIKLHCAALAESLLESELFGHERGAFTGAERRRIGRFEQADGGTLFLDEIGEISPATQVKLLRVLQEHEFERVGGNHTVSVDVRVVAATNRDLKQMVSEGKFREDLYYRLNVIDLHLPPLRERSGDVGALAFHFLRKYAAENDKEVTEIDDLALQALSQHLWPGNVRELENVIERAVVLASGRVITKNELPRELQQLRVAAEHESSTGRPRIPGASMAELERYAILETLAHVGGSNAKAAEILGISVRTIQYRLREYAQAPKSQTPVLADEPRS